SVADSHCGSRTPLLCPSDSRPPAQLLRKESARSSTFVLPVADREARLPETVPLLPTQRSGGGRPRLVSHSFQVQLWIRRELLRVFQGWAATPELRVQTHSRRWASQKNLGTLCPYPYQFHFGQQSTRLGPRRVHPRRKLANSQTVTVGKLEVVFA